jgi:DHA3 family macrolide efflux protein-like MFS transporter
VRFVRPWDSEHWVVTFTAVWGAEALSLFGTQLVQFALVWWIVSTLQGSATMLAGATLVALFPQIVVAPLAGALVDRWDRRWVLIFANAGIALSTIALAALFFVHSVQLWHIYVAMFIRSTGAAFRWPAMQASTAMMVPQRHLARVAGLNNSLFGLASIVSPSLGALLIEVGLPMYALLTVDVAAACLAIVPLLLVRIPLPERAKPAAARSSVFTDFAEGLRFVLRWHTLFALLAAAGVIMFFSYPANSLIPLLVTKHFHGGAIQFGGMQSAFGLGVVAGGAFLGIWGGFKKRMTTALLSLLLQGVGFAAVGIVPSTGFPMAIAAMALVGLMNPICTGSLFAIVQSTVPHEMQGRIMSLLISLSSLAAPLGLAAAGPIADRYGIGIWFLVAGIVMMAVAVLSAIAPAVRDVEARGAPPHLRRAEPSEPSPPAER